MRYSSDNQLAFDLQADGSYLLFLTPKAIDHLEEVVVVFFPQREPLHFSIKEGEALAVIESTKSAIDIQAPFELTLLKVNDELTTQPHLLKERERGWLVQVAIDPKEIQRLSV